MEDQGKKPQRKENALREWVSDNLRYIILIVGVAAIIAVVILGIRFISSRTGTERQEPQTTSQSGTTADPQETGSATPTVTPSAAATPTATATPTDAAAPTVTATPSATATPAASSASSPTPEAPDADGAEEQEIQNLLTAYYQALSDKNPDALAGLVDRITDEDRAAVSGNQLIDSYSDVQTYIYAGADSESYVVLAAYNYRYSGYDQELPALTQFYVYGDGGGHLWLASDVPDSAAQARVQEVLNTPEVRELIDSTQAAYEEVLNSSASLRVYVESLS